MLRLALTEVFEQQKLQAEFKLRVEEASYYSFSSAFAIPALSCYLIIVTAAIVGNWVVDGGGQKSTEQSPASTLVTILIVFIWLYSVLFVAIPSMGWRDVSGANPFFLKVFKFAGFLTPKLTLYLQISWPSFYCLLSPTIFISRFMALHLSGREQVTPHSQTIKYDCRLSRLYTLSRLSITSKIKDSCDSNVHLQLVLFTRIIIIMIGVLGAVSKDTETWLAEIGVKCCLESLQKACLLGTARLGHLRSPAVTGCLRKTPANHPEAIFNEDSNNNNNNNNNNSNNN